MNDFERCLKQGKIVKIEVSPDMMVKELDGSLFDLSKAQKNLRDGDAKWASVQAYYSMFHFSKALVLSKGYREKNHYCLIVAMKELFVKNDDVEMELIDDMENAMLVRHEADYGLEYDLETAQLVVDAAQRLIEKMKWAFREIYDFHPPPS